VIEGFSTQRMQTITAEQLIEILKSLGLQTGDGVMVHSAVHFLGKPHDGMHTYYKALSIVLGLDAGAAMQTPNGTLVVPAFNFGFARGEAYDPQTTSSQGMGVFSEYVRQLSSARRTNHPMQSLAVVGKYADDLCQRDTLSAFDPGSAFERMLELDFKLLLLGADIQAVSMLHYSEQCAVVPYRYWKDFTGKVRRDSDWELHTYRMYVRDLDLNPQLSLLPVQRLLEERFQWLSVHLNYGKVVVCRMRNFVKAVDEILQRDPCALVVSSKQPANQKEIECSATQQ
jgi:aminoglycoside 3-N-acetyltransferase